MHILLTSHVFIFHFFQHFIPQNESVRILIATLVMQLYLPSLPYDYDVGLFLWYFFFFFFVAYMAPRICARAVCLCMALKCGLCLYSLRFDLHDHEFETVIESNVNNRHQLIRRKACAQKKASTCLYLLIFLTYVSFAVFKFNQPMHQLNIYIFPLGFLFHLHFIGSSFC